jgi:Zn finger protein HypA/HybF involved in hydrogenase expression
MDKNLLESLIDKGLSTYKISKELGKSNNTIIYWISSLGLSDKYKNRPKECANRTTIKSFNKEELEKVVKISNSISDVLRHYNKPVSGRAISIISKHIKNYNIDIDHFNAENRNYSNKPNSDFFVKGIFRKGSVIKKRLRNIIPYVCSECGLGEIWNERPIVLQIDHLDGDNRNNELKNLSIKCPNCHSQTKTFAGRNVKLKKLNIQQ